MPDASTARARAVAFFDVDGTLVQTTIVHYYMYFRRRRMSQFLGRLWLWAYLLKCGYYIVLDKMSRSRMNIVFYRGYAKLGVKDTKSLVEDCHRDVIKPRLYEQGASCVQEHCRVGQDVVLVTGSIDFIIKPLARELGVSNVLAPTLVESNDKFTGELDGPPIGEEEKARRVRHYARTHGLDLAQCHAYGDSVADLPMLESVGFPHAVNPDRALAAIAKRLGWPVHHWTVARREECGRP